MAHIETERDQRNDLIIHRISGQVTGDEIIQRIKEDLNESFCQSMIWDFTQADMQTLSVEKLHQVLAVGKSMADARKHGKTAIVAPQDLSFGMGRMYEAFTEIEKFATSNRSFRNLEQAMQWLDISQDS